MKLSPYLFAEDPAHRNTTLIVGTLPPFPVGHVWRFKNGADLDAWVIGRRQRGATPAYNELEAYNVVIEWKGYMGVGYVYDAEKTAILAAMAQFLQNTRIEADKSYWKRYSKTS